MPETDRVGSLPTLTLMSGVALPGQGVHLGEVIVFRGMAIIFLASSATLNDLIIALEPPRPHMMLNSTHREAQYASDPEQEPDEIPQRGDTIAALSTGTGLGAIGIVRMSGPDAVSIAESVFRAGAGESLAEAESHRLLYGHVVDPSNGHDVDEVLVAIMLGPRSYTREDVVEVHCHGGVAAQRAVLRLVLRRGARLADPGEFTKRAFLNGRIDLAQAESVAAIVAARSSGALRASVRQLEGGLSATLRDIRRKLIGLLAQIEASLDFADEDIEAVDWEGLEDGLREVQENLERLLRTAFLGRALEYGLRTAIVGRPNVGKSSLLNALLMRERAIVSDVPGTTRDTVEELLEIGGIPIHLVDTAGIRAGGDHVERLGVARSVKAMEQADLVLAVLDVSRGWDEEDVEFLRSLDCRRTVVVCNKLDLLQPAERKPNTDRPVGYRHQGKGDGEDRDGENPEVRWTDGEGRDENHHGDHSSEEIAAEAIRSLQATLGVLGNDPDEGTGWRVCGVSARTGQGLDFLRLTIEAVVSGGEGLHLEEPVLASERQRGLVAEAFDRTEAAVESASRGNGEELVCEDIRQAVAALGRITGEDLTEDLLDEIFNRFCIGK